MRRRNHGKFLWRPSTTTTIASAQSAAPEVPHVIDAHWHADLAPGDLDTAEAKSKRQKTMAELDAMNVSYLVVNGVPDAIAVWRKEFPDRVIPALLFPCKRQSAELGKSLFSRGRGLPRHRMAPRGSESRSDPRAR